MKQEILAAGERWFALAVGEHAPPIEAFALSDGRMGRRTLDGVEFHELLPETERTKLFAWARAQGGGAPGFSVRSDEIVAGGFVDATGHGKVRLAVRPGRRWSASDFSRVLPETLFSYLQTLVAIGENVWILGDTGVECELGAALCPEDHSVLSVPPCERPAPFGAAALASGTSLTAALDQKRQAGFDTLLFFGALGAADLELLAGHGGVVFCQRALSAERALFGARLLDRTDLGTALASIGAIVTVERTATGGIAVSRIEEFRGGEGGLDLVAIASTGTAPSPSVLVALEPPRRAARLAAAGLWNALLAFPARPAQPGDLDHPEEPRSAPEHEVDASRTPLTAVPGEPKPRKNAKRPPTGAFSGPLDRDPGWELDALEADALIAAPGEDGDRGMFRARPLVRPPPAAALLEADELGKLALDAPSLDSPGKVIIPEAPSSSQAKRSFAEILREHHRFPPPSEDGSPTLSPPALSLPRTGSSDPDDDIAP